MKTVDVPSGRVYINFTALSSQEIDKLNKTHKFQTETLNKTSGASNTYYVTYNQVKVAGPIVYKSGQNLIGLVVFSIAVGLVTAALGEDGKPLLRVVDTMNKVISRLVQYVMWYVFSHFTFTIIIPRLPFRIQLLPGHNGCALLPLFLVSWFVFPSDCTFSPLEECRLNRKPWLHLTRNPPPQKNKM